MIQAVKKIIVSIVFFLSMAVTTSCVNIQNKSDTSEKSNFIPQAVLDKKIEYYRRLYPEMTFLILQGDDKLLNDMITLDSALGSQPESLDYEHPPELREDLMYVSVERIWFMLKSQIPSASLFKVTLPRQEHICVLTINPTAVAADSNRSTGHLLDLPQEIIQKIPQDLQLPSDDYLEFVIDHEVYHCLKSMYVGPQLMSYKELWSGYNQFHEEQGADTYAVAMHIKTKREISIFAKNIIRIRGMALYNADPDHLTCKALEQLIKVPLENITKMSSNEVFDMANSIKKNLTISYDEYVQQLASAVQAMKEIGVEDLISEELDNNLKGIQPDPVQVKEFISRTRRNLEELSGNEFEP